MYLSTLVLPRKYYRLFILFSGVPFFTFTVGPRPRPLRRTLRLPFHSLAIKALYPSDSFIVKIFRAPPHSYHCRPQRNRWIPSCRTNHPISLAPPSLILYLPGDSKTYASAKGDEVTLQQP